MNSTKAKHPDRHLLMRALYLVVILFVSLVALHALKTAVINWLVLEDARQSEVRLQGRRR